MALLPAETDHISVCTSALEMVRLRRLFIELRPVTGMKPPADMNAINQAAMNITKSNAVNERNKQIDARFHYTRQHVREKVLFITAVEGLHYFKVVFRLQIL